jgi:hypothetical protein
MVTETPPVKAALDELRQELGQGAKVDFGELVTLGAQAKADALRRAKPEAVAARGWLAERIRAADLPVDVDAADDAKRRGLIVSDAAP